MWGCFILTDEDLDGPSIGSLCVLLPHHKLNVVCPIMYVHILHLKTISIWLCTLPPPHVSATPSHVVKFTAPSPMRYIWAVPDDETLNKLCMPLILNLHLVFSCTVYSSHLNTAAIFTIVVAANYCCWRYPVQFYIARSQSMGQPECMHLVIYTYAQVRAQGGPYT